MKKKSQFLILFLLGLALTLSAQSGGDFGFGFGFDDVEGEAESDAEGGAGGGSPGGALSTGVRVGGKVSAGLTVYPDDFTAKDDESAQDRMKQVRLYDIFSGELNFSAESSNAAGIINLKIAPDFEDPTQILLLDEAYVRAFYGNLTVSGGLRKLTWGRADSFGPMDVINPLDYSDLTRMTDFPSVKISRPMLHASYGIGSFTKIEGVFLPWFEGDRFAQSMDNRWTTSQIKDMAEQLSLYAPVLSAVKLELPSLDLNQVKPDTTTLEYFQGGLRFTTTIGPSDFGVQYYYGYLPRPAATRNAKGVAVLERRLAELNAAIATGGPSPTPAQAAAIAAAHSAAQDALNPGRLYHVAYNRYHQIGVDYGQVLFGFNTRAELAANITGDTAGDDGLVYNPAIVWSLGFDRDIPVVKVNVNLQVNESIRLFHNKVKGDPLFDIEAGKDITSTRLTLRLSRTFFRDELKLQATAIWGIEDKDCYIVPAIFWTQGDVALEVSGGIFAGDKDGELGQYRDNYFIKTLLSYSF
jgi:hypothetical protein